MADIYGSHFEYGGIDSSTYGLIIANVESTRFNQVAGTITPVTLFSKRGKKNYLIDDDYSGSPLSFEVDIVTDDEHTLSQSDRRAIERWLFNRHSYRKLYLNRTENPDTVETVDGSEKRLYMNCRFINAFYLEYQCGIVGYRVTLATDCGYWWQDAVTKTFSLGHTSENASTVIHVDVDADVDDYTYPKVTVIMNSSGGDLYITNNTDSDTRMTAFTALPAGATVTIDSNYNFISGQYYDHFYRQYFPRLLTGNNTITVRGNVQSIAFEYSNRRNL